VLPVDDVDDGIVLCLSLLQLINPAPQLLLNLVLQGQPLTQFPAQKWLNQHAKIVKIQGLIVRNVNLNKKILIVREKEKKATGSRPCGQPKRTFV
jgi:hypothetical protein